MVRDGSHHQSTRSLAFTFEAKHNTIRRIKGTTESGYPLYHRTQRADGAYSWQGYEAGNGRAPTSPRDGVSLPTPSRRFAGKTGHRFWKTQKGDFHSWVLLASSRRSGMSTRSPSKVAAGVLGAETIGERGARSPKTRSLETTWLERTGCLGVRIAAE